MRAPRALLCATYAAVGVYVAVLLLVPDLFAPWFRDTVLGNLAFVAAVALLVRRAAAEPATRFWTLPLATGTTVYLVGNVAYMVAEARGVERFPSVADVAYLLTYPLLVSGLLMALRHNLRGARLIVALDGISGMLAGAAVTTLVVAPLVSKVWDGSVTAATILAYPVCAVVALAATLGADRPRRARQGPVLPGLGGGDAGLRGRRHPLRLPARLRELPRRHLAGRAVAAGSGARRRGGRRRPDRRHPPGARCPVPGGRRGGVDQHGRGARRGPTLAAELPADGAGPADADDLRRTPGAGVPPAARARRRPRAGADRRAHRRRQPAGAVRRAGQGVRRATSRATSRPASRSP